MRLRLPLVLVLAIALAVAGVGASPAASDDATSPGVDEVAVGTIRATIMPTAARSLSLFGSGVSVVDRLDALGLATVETTPDQLAALEAAGLIDGYSIERPFELFLDDSTVTVEADIVNAGGNAGGGKAVAVIDSGIDADHPAFGDRVVREACFLDNINGICPSTGGAQTGVGPGTASPCLAGGCFHGTHVAGIVASGDATFPGVAPAADLVAVRITSNSGGILSSDVLAALDWVLSVVDTHDIVAVNLSLGSDEDPGACRDAPWEAAIAALNAAGVAVVAASGNSADLGLLPVAFPACLPGVISVGATERSSSDGLAPGSTPELTDFTQFSGTLDLVAPGFDITSAMTPGSSFTSLDGTSMAAPHVAGAFALLAGTQDGWTPDRFEELLRSTGEMVERYTASAGDRHDRYPEMRLVDAVSFDPFDDAAGGFWVAAADWAKHTGVSDGVGDDLFGPDITLNRAQAVTFLWRLMGEPAPSAPSGFADVPAGQFYTDAVAWAKEVGITQGTTPTTFEPGAPVSRGVMATFLWRLAGEPTGSLGAFDDVPVTAFYAEPVGWMADNGITTGTSPTTFSPDDVVNRAQMITFIWRLVNAADAWAPDVTLPDAVMF
ncbi:MAG: S8 family serine peptidase [Actinomycetota bacterium]